MPTSKELIEMANLEWKNREERKGIHDRVSWTSGWISGYLTRNPQAERERVLNDLEKSLRKYDSMKFVDVMYEIDKLRKGEL